MRTIFEKHFDKFRSRHYSGHTADPMSLWQDYVLSSNGAYVSPKALIEVAPVRFGPLWIFSLNPNAPRAILMAHGGYTPRRNMLAGSGTAEVPRTLQLGFRTAHDTTAYDRTHSAYHWRTEPELSRTDEIEKQFQSNQIDVDTFYQKLLIKEKLFGGAKVVNYRLECAEDALHVGPSTNCDIVHVQPGRVAHLHDVFNAYRKLGKSWRLLYSAACRVSRI